jgi:hypothetical protein
MSEQQWHCRAQHTIAHSERDPPTHFCWYSQISSCTQVECEWEWGGGSRMTKKGDLKRGSTLVWSSTKTMYSVFWYLPCNEDNLIFYMWAEIRLMWQSLLRPTTCQYDCESSLKQEPVSSSVFDRLSSFKPGQLGRRSRRITVSLSVCLYRKRAILTVFVSTLLHIWQGCNSFYAILWSGSNHPSSTAISIIFRLARLLYCFYSTLWSWFDLEDCFRLYLLYPLIMVWSTVLSLIVSILPSDHGLI